MVSREISVLHPEIALQFNGIARRQRHHGLQPERGGEGYMAATDLAESSLDLGGTVQHQPPAHPGRGAGVDLVEQRCAEEVGAVRGRHKAVVRSIKSTLVVVVGVVNADFRPGPDADIVVVVRIGLETRLPGLVDDAGGIVDAEPVEEGAAIGRDREAEAVGAEEADQRLGHEAGLKREPEIVGGRFLIHSVEQIAGAALGNGFGSPERGVQLGRERVRRDRPSCRAPSSAMFCRKAAASYRPSFVPS